MVQRNVIVNPGSASWWLLSLSPLLYYDQIEIDPNAIKDILDQGNRSSFHERTACMLNLILNNPNEKILYVNNSLPPRGQTKELKQESQKIANWLIREANNCSLRYPSLIKDSELKKALRTAYRYWIRYNNMKVSILQKDEPLQVLLIKEQIPQSLASLKKIEKTDAKKIPELLESDNQLRIVLQELIRNALLIMDLGKNSTKRVYDGLVDEFLPTIELVERVRIFHELPKATSKMFNFSLLTELYRFELNKIKSYPNNKRLNATEALKRAFQERARLKSLRLKIAEFDTLIAERNLKPDRAMKDLFALIKDINSTIKRIDSIGTWAMWGTGAYLLVEVLSSLSPSAQLLLKSVLLNPLTVKATKEFMQNYYISLSGLSPKSSSYISIIRDYIAIHPSSESGQIYKSRPNIFKFWV